MRLTLHQLSSHLKQALLPLYLVSGDEPFQQGEALKQVRHAAQKQGYTEREVLEHEANFDWSQLSGVASSMSLFGDKRIIELRLKSPKVGTDGSAALIAYAERPPEDALLLISCGKLDQKQTHSKWVKTLDKSGALVNIWPVNQRQLPKWLEQRMKSRGLRARDGVAEWLAERVEGNLLAATQELEKYLLLYGPGDVDHERLSASVADSARYSVFDLSDSALAGDKARSIRVIRTLKQEGTPEALTLWALSKETRLLASLAAEQKTGRPLQQILSARRDIWESRRPIYAKALKRKSVRGWQQLLIRCAQADAVIKGEDQGDIWSMLEDIVLGIAGMKPMGFDMPVKP